MRNSYNYLRGSMHYRISAPNPVSHYIRVECTVDNIASEELHVQLPSWRPGRYEIGNFAKNVRSFDMLTAAGEPVIFRKISKDAWLADVSGIDSLRIVYEYYAATPDAGSCWVDEEIFYINPVHCCVFIPDRMNEECVLELDIPKDFRVATSLERKEDKYVAANIHELADSPVMAGLSMQVDSYTTGDITFHVWFLGQCRPDWPRILNDFKAFTKVQLDMMGDFPSTDYHFLVFMLPFRFYHGVEHLKSTVLALGPGSQLMSPALYTDFTGVASHELFHVWNIKTIRPQGMIPYNYSRENYSRLGFVYEGVTTYYGDLFLVRSGVYSISQYFSEIALRLQKHFDNPGRKNLSVADSSFDTWLDGYVPGAPGRKTSIYDEGCLIALMTDLLIRRSTNGNASLDNVMKILYDDFGKKGIGYSEQDYMTIVESVAGTSVADFFLDYVYGTEDYAPMLSELLSHVGCELIALPAEKISENLYGFRVAEDVRSTRVTAVMPGSPAETGGLGKDDEIIAVNERKVEQNLNDLCNIFKGERLVLTVLTPMKNLKDIVLEPSGQEFYNTYTVRQNKHAGTEAKEQFRLWLKQDF